MGNACTVGSSKNELDHVGNKDRKKNKKSIKNSSTSTNQNYHDQLNLMGKKEEDDDKAWADKIRKWDHSYQQWVEADCPANDPKCPIPKCHPDENHPWQDNKEGRINFLKSEAINTDIIEKVI